MTNNGDGWYTYTFNSATAATIIFNDGTNQSVDSYRDKNGWYMDGVWYDTKPFTPPVTWTVNFFKPAAWATTINIYWYNALPSGSLPSVPWPGVPMTNNGDGWYSYTFTNISSAVVIFNDGSSQTADLPRIITGWYLDGVWYDTKPVTNAAPKGSAVIISGITQENAPETVMGISYTTIYPNPAKGGSFNVCISGLKNNEQATITVVDAGGKRVLETRSSQSGKINYNLKSGVYYVVINSSGMHITKKLVIE
jgi:hypothetical protein